MQTLFEKECSILKVFVKGSGLEIGNVSILFNLNPSESHVYVRLRSLFFQFPPRHPYCSLDYW